LWSETVSWAWRFKGDDAWLTVAIAQSKYLKGGDLRYLPGKGRYQFTAGTRDGRRQVYEGRLKNGVLTLECADPETGATRQLKMNVAGDGVRFLYRAAHRDAGTTLWKKDYVVACTKEGESLAARERKNECVVSGGLGTMAVSYKGETY